MTTLDVGVLGAGPWGRNLIRAFDRADRCRVAAICDIDPAALEPSLAPRARLSTRPEDILDDPRIAACVVATPSQAHADVAVAALDAGKHVFVEKPMALGSADAARIRAAAVRAGRRVMVGHLLKYHPAVVELRRRIDAGELGEPRYLVSQRLGPHNARRTEGTWWSLAPHDLSLAQHLFRAAPTSLSVRRHALERQELIVAELGFPGGRAAVIVVGTCDPAKVRRVTLVGSERSAVFDDTLPDGKLKLYRASEVVEVPPLPRDEPLVCEARHFAQGIIDGAPLASDIDDGADVVSLLELGDRSMAQDGARLSR